MKKMVVALMVFAISFASISASVFANESKSVIPISAQVQLEAYTSFTGKIVGMTQDDIIMLIVEDKDGTRMQFIITADTYTFADADIMQGNQIKIFYDLSKVDKSDDVPTTDAVVATLPEQKESIFIGSFVKAEVNSSSDKFVSKDNTLIIQNTSKVETVTADGKPFIGNLEGQKVVVLYTTATKSLPAQTTPTKIIVLNETPISPQVQLEAYTSFTGKIVGMTQDDIIMLIVEDKDGARMQFVITADTYKFEDADIMQGNQIKIFYDLSKVDKSSDVPTTDAVVATLPEQKESIFIGSFVKAEVNSSSDKFASKDNTLIIQNTSKVETVTADGKPFTGNLEGQKVVVLYTTATKSLPAQTTPTKIIVLNDTPISPQVQLEAYTSFTGKIVGMTQDDIIMLIVEDKDGTRMQFIITADTYTFADADIMQGNQIKIFYDLSKVDKSDDVPTTDAVVATLPEQKESIFIGSFVKAEVNSSSDKFVSKDNTLIIQNTSKVETVTADGKPFTGNLEGQKVVVLYTTATKSLPAQTTPTKIIVLNETENVDRVASMPIIVNGTVIKTTAAFTNQDNVIMVPLRPIAEALGYEVTWEHDTQTVRLGNTISLQIGKNAYNLAKMSPIQLHAAPEIINDRTYVPLDFFSDIVKAKQVTATEGNITINMIAQ